MLYWSEHYYFHQALKLFLKCLLIGPRDMVLSTFKRFIIWILLKVYRIFLPFSYSAIKQVLKIVGKTQQHISFLHVQLCGIHCNLFKFQSSIGTVKNFTILSVDYFVEAGSEFCIITLLIFYLVKLVRPSRLPVFLIGTTSSFQDSTCCLKLFFNTRCTTRSWPMIMSHTMSDLLSLL